jgi:hypothetical protein
VEIFPNLLSNSALKEKGPCHKFAAVSSTYFLGDYSLLLQSTGTQCFTKTPKDKLKSIYLFADRNTMGNTANLSTSKCVFSLPCPREDSP